MRDKLKGEFPFSFSSFYVIIDDAFHRRRRPQQVAFFFFSITYVCSGHVNYNCYDRKPVQGRRHPRNFAPLVRHTIADRKGVNDWLFFFFVHFVLRANIIKKYSNKEKRLLCGCSRASKYSKLRYVHLPGLPAPQFYEVVLVCSRV